MSRHGIAVAGLCVLGLVVSTGCARLGDLNRRLVSLAEVSKKAPNAPYIVDPPDTIRVEFVDEPQLTREVQLRSDGFVTLPLLEDVHLAGRTTPEIRERLEELYAKFYKEPQILVTVTQFRSKHIYVYGEVGRQGQIPYTGYQTLSDAIGTAGGVTRRAAWGRVKVIRGDPEDPEVFSVDLDDLVLDGDTRWDVSLAENDVIYVPPTVLAWIGYQIESLLFPTRGVTSLVAAPQGL
ncbi:MAG: polysaccharide biosynthesis/export family protein [Candidatus Brocadiaceae bacterium]|jgi:polysaccharide export outer membrane protein